MPYQQNENEIVSGEKLYLLQITGGYNKIPVQRVTDGVVASLDTDIELDRFNFLKRFSAKATYSGSMILFDEEKSGDYEILPGDVLFIDTDGDTTIAYLFICVDGERWVLQVWEEGPETTTVSVYPGIEPRGKSIASVEALRNKLKDVKPAEQFTFDSDGVFIVENDQGILVPVRKTLGRLNDLMELNAQSSDENSLKWFLPGFVGNPDKLNAKIGSRFMPLPSDVDPKSAANSALSDMIFKEVALLLPLYFQSARSYTLMPRESGISRYLNMQGYINRVKLTQKLAQMVFNELWNETIEFSNLIFSLTLETAEGNTGGSIASVSADSEADSMV